VYFQDVPLKILNQASQIHVVQLQLHVVPSGIHPPPNQPSNFPVCTPSYGTIISPPTFVLILHLD
jgi:hypothetical protein